MRPTTSMTIAALVVATITAGSAAPALAQDQDGERGRHMQQGGPGEHGLWLHRDGPRDGGMRMRMTRGGGFFALVCSERGGDQLEHMLLDVAQRTDPTADQQPLYDALKNAALAAQADFAAACATARPGEADATARDLADRLQARLAIEKAHVEAMTAVLPAFEAFYDSLSDEQKLQLEPRRHGAERRLLDEPREDRGRPNDPARPS